MHKTLIVCLLFCVVAQACEAQYYYKDLVVNRENSARWKGYRDNHVKAVTLNSMETDGKPTEGFVGEIQVSADYLHITTHTKTSGTADAWIITDYSPQGHLIKNTDTSDTYQNSSEYRYDAKGRIM